MTLSLPLGTPAPAAALPAVQPEAGPQALPPSGSAMLFIDALAMAEADATGTGLFAMAPAGEARTEDASHDDGHTEAPLPGMSLLMPPVMILMPQETQLPAETPVAQDDGSAAASMPAAAANAGTAVARDAAAVAGAQAIATAGIPMSPGTTAAADRPSIPAHANDSAHATTHPQQQAADMAVDREQKSVAPADAAARTAVPTSLQHAAVHSAEVLQAESPKPVAASAAHSRQALIEALGERIQVQVGRRIEHAVIRLDPPMMGSIEVIIRHEAGNLQVQLSATHNEVLRQLQNIGDSLRQDLAQRQYTDVSVLVSNDMRDGEGRQRPRHAPHEPDEPGRALSAGDDEPAVFSLQRDKI